MALSDILRETYKWRKLVWDNFDPDGRTLDTIPHSDGAGGITWKTAGGAGGSPGGVDTQLQYNNGGAFGGAANWTYDDVTGRLRGTAEAHIDGPIYMSTTLAQDGDPIIRIVDDVTMFANNFMFGKGVQQTALDLELAAAGVHPTAIFFDNDNSFSGRVVIAAEHYNNAATPNTPGASIDSPDRWVTAIELAARDSPIGSSITLSVADTTGLVVTDVDVLNENDFATTVRRKLVISQDGWLDCDQIQINNTLAPDFLGNGTSCGIWVDSNSGLFPVFKIRDDADVDIVHLYDNLLGFGTGVSEDGFPLVRLVEDTTNGDSDFYLARGIQYVAGTWELGEAGTAPAGIFFNTDNTTISRAYISCWNHDGAVAGTTLLRPEDAEFCLEMNGGTLPKLRVNLDGSLAFSIDANEIFYSGLMRGTTLDITELQFNNGNEGIRWNRGFSVGGDQRVWDIKVNQTELEFSIWDDTLVTQYIWLDVARSGLGAAIQVDSLIFSAANFIRIGNFDFDTTQVPGAANDGHALTYTDATGLITLQGVSGSKELSFNSPAGGSGTFYFGGFYKFHTTAFTPSATPVTVGSANSSYAAHAILVLGAASTDMRVGVTGTAIDDNGVRSPSSSEVIDTSGGSANDYFETTKKYIGAVEYVLSTGTAVTINAGFAKYWDNSNSDFTVTGLEATWLGGANDSAPDIELLHHRLTGWTYGAGGSPTPPAAIASMNTDHGTESQVVNGENGAWKRVNLSTAITGTASEGTIWRITTTANRAFELGNLQISYVAT